jgi:hypothetical protein
MKISASWDATTCSMDDTNISDVPVAPIFDNLSALSVDTAISINASVPINQRTQNHISEDSVCDSG